MGIFLLVKTIKAHSFFTFRWYKQYKDFNYL